MTPFDINQATPACPRCGYDMRGATATWREACPLEGTCTECGLTVQWAEVLIPEKFEPPWCVEFVKPATRFAWGCGHTLGRSVRPFRFWSALKMSMPLRPRRLAGYAAMLLLPVVAAALAVQVVAAVKVRSLAEQQLVEGRAEVTAEVTQIRTLLQDPALGPQERGRLQGMLRQMQPWNAPGAWAINHSYAAAVAEAVLFPWRSTSRGTVTRWAMVLGYTPPRELHLSLMHTLVGGRPMRSPKAWGSTLLAIVGATWVSLSMPFAFVLLPVSRRRAKVRWTHLVRVGVYGLAIPAAVLVLMLAFVAACYAGAELFGPVHALAHGLGRYGMIIAVLAWWTAAIRRYLQMPNAWAVPPVLAVFLVLVLAAAVYLVGSALT